ncbi:MAG: hypothetical protein H7A51_16650 [Akkermansiaceae bacterium]|nr:hypothetical protein [Akkermansiaceae bacterium]
MMFHRTQLLFASLCAAGIGHTSLSAAPEADSVRVNIRVVCVAYHDTVRKIEISKAKSDARLEFSLFDDAFSNPQMYKGPSAVPVFSPGQEKPFTHVNVPEGAKDVIFLCLPTAADSVNEPYRILAVNGGSKSFPFGTRRVFNLTRTNIGLRYGATEKREVIAPGVKPTDLVITEQKAGSERFPIEFFYQQDTQWVRFSATRWTVDPTKRTFLFIVQNPASNRIRYRAVSEYYVDPALVKQKEEEAARIMEQEAKDAENEQRER